ncbi:MAG: N-acetyl-gamma-glutamyl-phosphate reductase [Defluviitaleaceae bacterium]|nr:N-acetyl-gamma-glutamyl-phosphate reductase [Defluviitaleaceae bacterium]
MNVFIDGNAGTTGLKLEERLRGRGDITLLKVDDALRKDQSAKKAVMDEADVIFLCLPDDAARESAAMAGAGAIVIDASTAHRADPGWVYGLPELSQQRRLAVSRATRIAVPGCHASGFISMVYPLVSSGLLSAGARLNCVSLTGYSGGGRGLIDTYENGRTPGDMLCAPRPYALGLTHKHLPEMTAQTGLTHEPHFYPVCGDMARGMLVSVHLWADQFAQDTPPEKVWEALAAHYSGSRFIRVMPLDGESPLDGGFLDPTACNGTNDMEIFVFGNSKQMLLAARLDNLGKGASGAAVQCMNIACGIEEHLGL